MRIRLAVAGGVLALLLGGPSAHAQLPRYTVTVAGGQLRLQSTAAALTDELSGTIISGRGTLAARGLELDVAYYEGSLRARQGSPPDRDIADGHAMLGGRPRPWLLIQGGMHARGYVEAGGISERWVLWEARGRGDVPLIGQAVRAHLEIHQAIVGNVTNGAGSYKASRAAEGGIGLRLPRTPLWLGVTYGFERNQVKAALPDLDAIEVVRIGISSSPDR